MARYQSQTSHVVFQPSPLTLSTNKHRAALEGNETSVLTGVDPRSYGKYRRMPGGRYIPAATIRGTKPVKEAFRSRFFNLRGLRNGHIPIAMASAVTVTSVTVDSTFGFEEGDWIAIFDPTDYQNRARILATITTIDRGSRVLNYASVTTGDTGGVGSNQYVVRCFPAGYGYLTGFTTGLAQTGTIQSVDIQVGDIVYIVFHNDQCTETTLTEYQIKDITASTISWDPPLVGGQRLVTSPSVIKAAFAFIPKIPFSSVDQPSIYLTYEDARVWQIRGSDSANPIWDGVYDTAVTGAPWSMCPMDRQIAITNGTTEPTRITEASSVYDSTVSGQADPLEPIGFPEAGVLTPGDIITTASTGGMTTGTHTIFLRFLDRSVIPTAKSPPVMKTDVNIAAAAPDNQKIQFNFGRLFNIDGGGASTHKALFCGSQYGLVQRAYRKATHYEIWMTPVHTVSTTDFYLVDSGHLSNLTTATGAGTYPISSQELWNIAYQIAMNDEALVTRERLDEANDMDKGLMPMGKYIHSSQGITFVAGETASGVTASEHPKLTSGNVVHFSRTDVSEPENFPPENAQPVGKVGDQIMGFVDAGDVTVILNRFSFTTAQRAGTFVIWREGDVYGGGCAYEDAYVSLGSHAAWVSDERLWLFNGRTMEAPRDIGAPIRDWIQGLRNNKEVRMGYDPSNYMLWIGTRDQNDLCECKVYSFEEDTWCTMEDVWLSAPVTAYGMFNDTTTFSDSSRLYRFPGDPPTMHSAVDYYNRPINQCFLTSTDTADYTFSGTVDASGGGGITTIGSLTLPALESSASPLEGSFVRLIHGTTGAETVKVVDSATTAAVNWVGSYSGTASDKYIICGIPFRVRYPVLRGQDIFTVKRVRGAQFIFDDVNQEAQSGDKSLTVNLLRNFRDVTDSTEAARTVTISTAAGKTDVDKACDVAASGKTVELEAVQVDSHIDFSLVYAACRVSIPGILNEDRSTAV